MADFDPEGSGYDEKRGNELAKEYPLTLLKPKKYQGDYVTQKDAYRSWVWHPELNDYKQHGGSLDPKTGRSLKGMKHPTQHLSVEAERKRGSHFVKEKDGYYYSRPKKKLTPTENYMKKKNQGFGVIERY